MLVPVREWFTGKRTRVILGAAVGALVVSGALIQLVPQYAKKTDVLQKIVVTASRIPISTGIFWNLWFEEGEHQKAEFKPVEVLRRNTDFTLFAHLSEQAFKRSGVASSHVSPEILQKLAAIKASHAILVLRLVFDPTYFRASPDGQQLDFDFRLLQLRERRVAKSGRVA